MRTAVHDPSSRCVYGGFWRWHTDRMTSRHMNKIVPMLAILVAACDPTPEPPPERAAACREYREMYCTAALACNPDAGCPQQSQCDALEGTVTTQIRDYCVDQLSNASCDAEGHFHLSREGYGCVLNNPTEGP